MKKLSLFALMLLFSTVWAQNQLTITGINAKQVPSKYVNNSQYANQGNLLNDGNTSSYPQPYWGTNAPLIYDLDLGQSVEVSEIKFHDFEGGGVIRFYIGSTNNWKQVGSSDLDQYNKERSINVSETTRYIRLEIDGKVSEIKVFGSKTTTPPDSEISMEVLENFTNYAILRLDSLMPENTYSVFVNDARVGSFTTPKEQPQPEKERRAVHIVVDGLNTRILQENLADLPQFTRLKNGGAYSFKSITVDESTVTIPNVVSILTGRQVSEHGIDYNGDLRGEWDSSISTIFSTLPDTMKSLALVAKSKIATFAQGMEADQIAINNDLGNTLALIDQYKLGLHNYYFWHISRLDDIGHSKGWESKEYIDGLKYVDKRIGEVLDILDDETLVIVTADHGGKGTNHSNISEPDNREIPIFFYGKTVRNLEIQDSIYNAATANNAAEYLGLGSISGSTIDAACLTCPKKTPPDTTKRATKTLDLFVGTNVLPDDPISVIEPVGGNIRCYMYLRWVNDDVFNTDLSRPLKDIKINFDPIDAFNFNLDNQVKGFSELNETYFSLFESAMWLTGNNKEKLNSVAFKQSDGRSGLDNPNRWKYVSHLYYQFAARYGNTVVPDSKLITDSPKRSGLGYLSIYEGGNEKDRWWIGNDDAELLPEDHAAYYSALVDGHMNTMSENGVYFGVKNADPTAKVMLGGLAFVDFDELLATGKLEWFERFFGWFETHRTDPNYETIPIDFISFHDYPNTERKQRNLSGKGMPPEAYKWHEKHVAFREYLERRITSKRLLLINNEFGYDRNQGSPQRAEPYGGFSAEQVAGFWTVRCMLEAWSAKIYSAAQFYLRENGGGGSIFQSSGLTDKNQGYKPFAMYYYFSTMRTAMKGHDFVSRTVSGDLIKYETMNYNTGEKGWIYWHSSQSNKTTTQSLATDTPVLVTHLKNGKLEGDITKKSPSNGTVNISVSELPVFITEN